MIKPPPSLDPPALADWVEYSALTTPAGISRADVTRSLEGAGVDDNDEVNSLLGDISRHITDRRFWLRQKYPLRVTRLSFERKNDWRSYLAYMFLLSCTMTHHYGELSMSKARSKEPAEIFGFIARDVLGRYLDGQAVRFDAPRRAPLPTQFGKALDYLQTCTLERSGGGAITTGREKDDGLDVVAWKSLGDGRPGQVVILGQCAIGKNWEGKLSDLNNELWAKHLRWHVKPLRAMLVPFHFYVGDIDLQQQLWERHSTIAGIFFDRLRIARWLPRNGSAEVEARAEAWCDDQLQVSQEALT